MCEHGFPSRAVGTSGYPICINKHKLVPEDCWAEAERFTVQPDFIVTNILSDISQISNMAGIMMSEACTAHS